MKNDGLKLTGAIFIALAILTLLAGSKITLAESDGTNPPPNPSPGQNPGLINPLCPTSDPNCPRSDAEGLLRSIVDWLIKIGTPIAVGMILFGAFQIIFAGGDPEKFKNGRRTILYTAIGYAIILIGWGLTSIIQDVLSH